MQKSGLFQKYCLYQLRIQLPKLQIENFYCNLIRSIGGGGFFQEKTTGWLNNRETSIVYFKSVDLSGTVKFKKFLFHQ